LNFQPIEQITKWKPLFSSPSATPFGGNRDRVTKKLLLFYVPFSKIKLNFVKNGESSQNLSPLSFKRGPVGRGVSGEILFPAAIEGESLKNTIPPLSHHLFFCKI
jgi:hypothetical protein